MKNAKTYEHLEPKAIGNYRRYLVSELGGKTNIMIKARELELHCPTYAITFDQKYSDFQTWGYRRPAPYNAGYQCLKVTHAAGIHNPDRQLQSDRLPFY